MVSSVRFWSRPLVLAAVLIGAVVAAYALSLRGDFLWDDDLHITANPTIVGPLGLKEIWTTSRANYFPLVLTNFWIQHALWELNPLGYRIVTLLFHAGAAVLLWRVLLRLRVPGAWLGAALWALHPVQVESVAWICELKNTQSAVFFLAAIWAYVRWLEVGRVCDPPSSSGERTEGGSKTRPTWRVRRFYAFALVFAVLAILSKPSTVMLPVALAVCAWWLRRRFAWRDFIPLVPFFALSALAAGWTIWEQKYHSGAIGPEWSQTFPERLIIAGRVVWFYLGKLGWPDPLMFIYPRWSIDAAQPLGYVATAGVIVSLGLFWGWRARSGVAAVLVSSAYFVALLFPVLGFFSVYFFRYSFVGDHFQYLASIGPLALLGAALTRALPRGAPFVGGLILLALGGLTARQGLVYRNNEALWRDTIAHNPGAVMAWLNLGDTLAQAERREEALGFYRQALRLRPDDTPGLNDLGNLLVLLGRPAEALPHFARALALKPDFVDGLSNYGNALRALGRGDEALAQFQRAVALDPKHAEARNNLGSQLAEVGRLDEAVAHYEAALQQDPRHAGAHDNLGNALRQLGRVEDAITHHREALRLRPDFPEAHTNLGRALAAAGRIGEAVPHFERALMLKPSFGVARTHYAHALAAAGRPAEALVQLERALELAPESAQAHQNLGAAYAQAGRIVEAVARFQAAVKLEPDSAPTRANLGTALAAQSRWREAIPQLEAAARLQPDHAPTLAQLAVALVNDEQLAAAVPVFERALRLDAKSAPLHQNFGQLLRALGRNREAFEHFERAAELQRSR